MKQKIKYIKHFFLPIFFGETPLLLDKNESSNWEYTTLVDNFAYSSKNTEFIEFVSWTEEILSSRTFLNKAYEFIDIERKLKTEPVGKKRTELVNRLSKIKYE